jgi:imidazolonepropionase-like amidohydrolase
MTVLHLSGPVLLSAEESVEECWVLDGRITFEEPTGASAAQVERLDGWVLPGLVDAHCHVGLESHGAVSPERAREHALADREAGVLLIRDAGSPADTRWMQQRDDLPRLIRAGRHIARTKRYLRNYGHEIEPVDLVDYVRREARRADGWVKLVGDWIERDLGDLAPCWPVDALTAAVEAAHEEGARVTAHCFGEQSLRDFAEAGTDCIEHATGLQADTIEEFAARQIAIVPTLVNTANFPSFAEAGEAKYPRYAAHMRALYERRFDVVGQAHEAGIPVYVGTDAGGYLRHGLAAREVEALTQAGFSALEAISAATWAARAWLGRPGIEEGAPADLVVYSEDPRADVRTLAAPHRIVLRGSLL